MEHDMTNRLNLSSVVEIILCTIALTLLTIKPIAPIFTVLLIFIGIYLLFIQKPTPQELAALKLYTTLTISYFVVMAFSVLLSSEPTNDPVHLSRIAYFLFAPFIALAIYRSDISFEKFLISIKIEAILIGLIALYGTFIMGHMGYSGMYNANTFADIAVTLVLFSAISIKTESKREFIFTLVAVSFGILAIALSGSRGALVAITLMMLLYIIILQLMPNRDTKRVLILWVVAMSVLFGSLYLSDRMRGKLVLINTEVSQWEPGRDNTGSVGIRLEMYSAGIQAFLDSPWVGYGYYNATKAASRYATTDKAAKKMARYWHLHNEYISAMVNAGMMGLITLLALFIIPLRVFFGHLRSPDSAHYGAMGIFLILGYASLGLTHGELGYEYETLWFVTILAYTLLGIKRSEYTSV